MWNGGNMLGYFRLKVGKDEDGQASFVVYKRARSIIIRNLFRTRLMIQPRIKNFDKTK